jgi:hypothetical protein
MKSIECVVHRTVDVQVSFVLTSASRMIVRMIFSLMKLSRLVRLIILSLIDYHLPE